MGIDEGPVVWALRDAGVVSVQFARRNHRVLAHPVDRVAVDRELVRELVILPDLLELGERFAHKCRVENTNARCRCRIVAQLARFGLRCRCIERLDDVLHTVCGACCVNVSLDVRSLKRALARLDLEALHDPRVHRPHQDGADNEQGRADDGQAPPADDGCHDEQDGDERRNTGKNRAGRDDSVDVGVRRPNEQPAAAGSERRVLVEPDASGLQQQVDSTGDGELDAGTLRNAHLATVHAQSPVKVARGDGGDGRQQHDGRCEGGDRLVKRQLEQEERDVEVELRIGFTGRGAVEPGQHQFPARRRRDTREEPENCRDAVHGQATKRLDNLLVTIELRIEFRVDRSPAEREIDTQPHRQGHGDEADQEHD